MIGKKNLIYMVFYCVAFAILAKYLPLVIFIPLAVIIATAHMYSLGIKKRRRYLDLVDCVGKIRSESVPTLKLPERGSNIDELIYESFKDVTSELEKKCYQLVEKNIQLLSLKELGLTIISSLNERKVVDSVKSFISKGLGFREFFISITSPSGGSFNIYTYRDAFGRIVQDTIKAKPSEIEGMLHKAIVSSQPLFIRDPDMHPIGRVIGNSIFEESTMSTYIIVPLLKSAVTNECWKNEDCLLGEDYVRSKGFELDDEVCLSCLRFRVLGLICITDGFKAENLNQVDLISVETLGMQVSTILENSRLFNDLKKEETFRDNVINSMLSGLITVDTEGRIVLANKAAQNLSGYKEKELVGRSLDEIIVDSSVRGEKGLIKQVLQMQRRIFSRETWLKKKDGGKLPIILNTSFLLGHGKNVQGILALFNDLTHVKIMEKKIMHLDKLAALGRFSSSIAHEIRNPLTGIAAGIQYLQRTGKTDREQEENINFILEEVRRIDRFIGDLMSIVKVGDLIYQRISVESIVDECLKSLRQVTEEKGIRVATHFPTKSRQIYVDPDRLNQVIMNLLKNSIEASDQGDEIGIDVSFLRRGQDVIFDGSSEYAIIKISDSGAGMTPDERDKIFEPFFSTKHEGTGLGMYVAHSLVERHGGSIFVDSEKGKGTTFSIYLPVERIKNGESSKIRNSLGG